MLRYGAETPPHEDDERVTGVGPESRRRTRVLALVVGVVLAGALAWVALPRIRRHDAKVRFQKSAPGDSLYADRDSFAAAWNPATAPPGRRHLPRFPIPERIGKQLFPVDENQPWDDLTYLRRPPHLDYIWTFPEHSGGSVRFRTNSLGMRENSEPLEKKGDLRVLVTGDSHTEGVCNNVESFPHVLRRELLQRHPGKVIECLNAGKGSFTFYNYLGTLEKFLYLEPDVFVVAVYAGNDFLEVTAPYHYFEGTPRKPGWAEYQKPVEKLLQLDPAWLAQEGLSLKYFQHYPDEIPVAIRAAKEAVLDIQELCEAHAIRLAFVYVPTLFAVERRRTVHDPEIVELSRRDFEAMELGPSDLDVHDRMGDDLLAYLKERGIVCLDLREVFAARPERFYWLGDHHMDVEAHRAIGEALVPVIEDLQPAGLR
jgi:hypothetical protein